MANAQKLVDMGCNTAILAAFACEQPEIAVVIGLGQFFFDWFYPEAQTPTQFAPVDHATLDTELGQLRGQITDAIWKASLDTHTANVLTQSSDYWDIYRTIQKLKLNPKTFMPLSSQTYADCDSYFDLGKSNVLDQLSDARNQITMDSSNDAGMTDLEVAEHYTTTTGLYCLIGSLTCAYLKSAIVWRRAKHVLAWFQYDQYLDDKQKWGNQPAKVKAAHPSWEPKAVAEPKDKLLSWEDWADQDLAVSKLLEALDAALSGSLIAYSEGSPAIPATAAEPAKAATKGLQVRMAEHWAAAHTNMTNRVQQVARSVKKQPLGTPPHYYVEDFATNWQSRASTDADLIDLRRRVRCGALLAYEWQAAMSEFALSRVEEDDITKFGTAIKLWKAAGASIRFTLCSTVKGDTLKTIAAQKYPGHPEYAAKIFTFNKDTLTDPDVVFPDGQIIMLPDAAVLPDIE